MSTHSSTEQTPGNKIDYRELEVGALVSRGTTTKNHSSQANQRRRKQKKKKNVVVMVVVVGGVNS
jgi:hypothetical protein